MRPEVPMQWPWSPKLFGMISQWWNRDASIRPPFTSIRRDVQTLRMNSGLGGVANGVTPAPINHGANPPVAQSNGRHVDKRTTKELPRRSMGR